MKTITYEQLTPELARKGCFVTGMPNEAYHSYDGISKSGLDLVNISPAHYVFAEPRKSTRAMEIGTAIHAAILEPELFKRDYVLLKEVTDRRSSEYKQAVKATGSGELVLTGKEADHVTGMHMTAHANPDYAALRSEPHFTELSAFVECPETGVLLRCRFDFITAASGVSVDVKKTQDARYESFQKSIANYRYYVQDAFYSYVYELIAGEPLQEFYFLAVEENAPNTAKMYKLDDEAKLIGKREFMADLEAYAEADKTGNWQHYDTTTEMISLPSWKIDLDEEVEL